MLAAFVFAFPLATPEVARWVAGGALLGAIAGRPLAHTSLRLYVVLLGALAGALGIAALRSAALAMPALSAALGPADALSAINALCFAVLSFWLAAGLRTAALRQRLFRVVEVGFVGLSFAQALAAHRRGAINRPFELADSIIAAGSDPAIALFAIGALTAGLCVVVLLGERRPLRALLHLGFVFLILALAPGVVSTPVPKPPPGPMAQGDAKKGRQGDEQGGAPSGNDQSNNEQLEFRDNSDSQGRQVPLAVVLLHDDYSPPGGLYYFRQSAFSHYNGRRLVMARQAGLDEDLAPGFVFEPTKIADVPDEGPERVTLQTTVALLADHSRPFALEAPLSLEPLQNPDPGRFRRVYRATSAGLDTDYPQLVGRAAGDPDWNAEQRVHYTAAPDDASYRELAERIVAPVPDDDALMRAAAISLWLSQEGIYSLKSQHAQAEDPTAHFLFGDKTGYCVHFSHAAVYLMRALGIPARVGAGYVYAESARQGGSAMLLSGANAHAWPELYLEGVGWVIVDVSPERALDPAIQPPDADLQQLLGEMARGLKPLPQGEDTPFTPATQVLGELPRITARVLGFGLPLALLLCYLIKLWRRLAPMFGGRAAARRRYRAELDRLSELSLTRRFGESREAFASRLAELAPSFSTLTGEHVAATFGRSQDSDPRRGAGLSRALRRELAVRIPRKRRLFGLLIPWSFLYSR
jgi:transglutaminase-like putative cysteine protease